MRGALFAFRFHQFLAAGGTLYSTLEAPEKRRFALEGQYYAAGDEVGTAALPAGFLPRVRAGILHGGWRKGANPEHNAAHAYF